MLVFAATVSYQNTDNQLFFQLVGVFSSALLAQQAIDDFIEGVLAVEYPDSSTISEDIVECQFDQPILE